MGKDFRVLCVPTKYKRFDAALFGAEVFESMLLGGGDVPDPTFSRCGQMNLAEQRRPLVMTIPLRGVCDQNSRGGTFEKFDVILLDAGHACIDQGGVKALPPAIGCRQRKLRQKAR